MSKTYTNIACVKWDIDDESVINFGDAIIENEDIATQVINDDTFYIPDSAAAAEIQPGSSADLKSFDFVDNVSSDSVSSDSASSDSASSDSASSDECEISL